EIHNAIVRFGERCSVVVSQSKIQRELAENSPVVRNKHAPGILPENIVLRTVLNGCELRHAEKEVREIITRRRATKRETASCVCARVRIQLSVTNVSAKTDIVLSLEPTHRLGKAIRLIQALCWTHVV